MLDFATNEGSPTPNVTVYSSNNRTICVIPIENGDIGEAENIAETIIEALNAYGVVADGRPV